MDYSLPGTSVHGILQARLLEWVAISDLGGSSRPRHRTHVSSVSCTGKWILYHWATWEALRAEGRRVNEEDLGNSEGVGAGSQGSLGWTLALVAEVPQGHRDQSVWSLCWNVSLCPWNGSSSDRDLLTEIACRVLGTTSVHATFTWGLPLSFVKRLSNVQKPHHPPNCCIVCADNF